MVVSQLPLGVGIVALKQAASLVANYAHQVQRLPTRCCGYNDSRLRWCIDIVPLLAQLTEIAIESFFDVFYTIASLMDSAIAEVTVDYRIEIFIV